MRAPWENCRTPASFRLIDAGEDNGAPYLVYDHVEGERALRVVWAPSRAWA